MRSGGEITYAMNSTVRMLKGDHRAVAQRWLTLLHEVQQHRARGSMRTWTRARHGGTVHLLQHGVMNYGGWPVHMAGPFTLFTNPFGVRLVSPLTGGAELSYWGTVTIACHEGVYVGYSRDAATLIALEDVSTTATK